MITFTDMAQSSLSKFLAALALAAAAASTSAATPAAPTTDSKLDTAHIHSVYLDGDFDQALRALESQLKAKTPMTHAESVFVYKHLGVIYAANQKTRDKGKYYMYQLIEIEPTARILDMYASDMIHLIFRNVQEDYEMRHKTVAAQPSRPEPQPAEAKPEPRPAATRRDNRQMYYWVAGGAAVAATTIAVVLFLNSGDSPKTKTITVGP